MKKSICGLLSIIILLSLSACFLPHYYVETNAVGNFLISVDTSTQCVYIDSYNCENFDEDNRIVIPDEYDGKPITNIGGAPHSAGEASFKIDLSSYINDTEEGVFHGVFTGPIDTSTFKENCTVEDVVFTLVISKNITTIAKVDTNRYYPHINEDGSVTFYHPVFTIECSDENPHFYAKDGKLYSKETNSIVLNGYHE